ncbi:DUF3795 domain-containing protein [Candidatus Soleaferrea massiliensis]|uniref:DUF3795 domain-containing protein n=1 Tax=Candidatus Soleaferrea massiliensis TaxID=1470354 RepID=UPI00058FFF8F|nr:DUF3795 domain-containing protein [Candidatus Soleaferrea massiliensis]
MEKIYSCCGVVCSDCPYYPKECAGCPEIQGNVFWLEYTGGEVCDIYACCTQERKFKHCGQCEQLPCERYTAVSDPTKSEEENQSDLESQLAILRELREQQRNKNLS